MPELNKNSDSLVIEALYHLNSKEAIEYLRKLINLHIERKNTWQIFELTNCILLALNQVTTITVYMLS